MQYKCINFSGPCQGKLKYPSVFFQEGCSLARLLCVCIWWSPDDNLIELWPIWLEVPLQCHFKNGENMQCVWARSMNISSPWELRHALRLSGLRTPYVGSPFHSQDRAARWYSAKPELHVLSGSGEKPLLHWMELLQIHDCVPKNKPKQCLTLCVGDVKKEGIRKWLRMFLCACLCLYCIL